jgi:hypothetical protein
VPNPLRGEAPFKAGASKFTLLFDINVFCELEDETGLDLPALMEAIGNRPSFKLLRSIFCAGLQEHHPGTSIKEAGNIMSDAGMEGIKDALQRAMQAAMPAKADDDGVGGSEGKGPATGGGTG